MCVCVCVGEEGLLLELISTVSAQVSSGQGQGRLFFGQWGTGYSKRKLLSELSSKQY